MQAAHRGRVDEERCALFGPVGEQGVVEAAGGAGLAPGSAGHQLGEGVGVGAGLGGDVGGDLVSRPPPPARPQREGCSVGVADGLVVESCR